MERKAPWYQLKIGKHLPTFWLNAPVKKMRANTSTYSHTLLRIHVTRGRRSERITPSSLPSHHCGPKQQSFPILSWYPRTFISIHTEKQLKENNYSASYECCKVCDSKIQYNLTQECEGWWFSSSHRLARSKHWHLKPGVLGLILSTSSLSHFHSKASKCLQKARCSKLYKRVCLVSRRSYTSCQWHHYHHIAPSCFSTLVIYSLKVW